MLILSVTFTSFVLADGLEGSQSQHKGMKSGNPAGFGVIGHTKLKPKAFANNLSDFRKKLDKAKLIADLNEMISALEKTLQELKGERAAILNQLNDVGASIHATENKIQSTKEDITDIENTIAATTVATLGLGTPALVAALESKKDKLHELNKLLDALKSQRAELEEYLKKINDLIRETEIKLESTKQKKEQYLEKLKKVQVTSPRENERLLVDSDAEIRLRSEMPPSAIRLKIEQLPEFKIGARKSGRFNKAHLFKLERDWNWKSLEPAGSHSVRLKVRTVAKLVKHSLPTQPGTLKLPMGRYRVGVRRTNDTKWEWREFSIVGRISDSAFNNKPPSPPGTPISKDAPTSAKPDTGTTKQGTQNNLLKSPFQRK
jgi:predicted  nucleic acid-binding Zn-ribbon protein